MLFVVVSMVLVLLVAAVVVVYVAYPHRGARLPLLPGLGRAMTRAVEAAPVLHEHPHSVEHDGPPPPGGRLAEALKETGEQGHRPRR